MFYLVFDTETNGLPIRKDKNEDFTNVYLYQLAYYKYEKNLNLKSKINLFVDLDDYKNFVFIPKNNITKETLQNKGKKIKKILDFLNGMLNDVCLLIAHNLTFDINVLLTEAKRNNNMELYDKLLTIPKFDTMRYAGSLGLKLINRPFPSQEDVYNLIFYNQQPKSKSKKSKVQALTFDEMDGKQEDKQETYKTLHDADDDTKHCGEIFCVLIKRWKNNILRFGKFKNLNLPFYKQSKHYENWALNIYYVSLKEFKDENLKNNKSYYQTYFTDYLNYVKFKYPQYIKNINFITNSEENKINKAKHDIYDDEMDYDD